MPDPTIVEKLKAFAILLREGRVQEADNQITTLASALEEAAQRAKLEQPADQPMTDEQLQLAVFDEIDRLHGYPPRLHALMIEVYGRKLKPKD
jgi:hypothetical protein